MERLDLLHDVNNASVRRVQATASKFLPGREYKLWRIVFGVVLIYTLLVILAYFVLTTSIELEVNDRDYGFEPGDVAPIIGSIPDEYCEETEAAQKRRVLHGTCVDLDTYNAIAFIIRKSPVSGAQALCTGTVIAPRYILTAEHCMPTNAHASDFTMYVLLNCIDIASPSCTRRGIIHIHRTGRYKDLGPDTLPEHDIVLYELESDVPAEIRIPDVHDVNTEIHNPYYPEAGTSGVAMGFGVMNQDGDIRFLMQSFPQSDTHPSALCSYYTSSPSCPAVCPDKEGVICMVTSSNTQGRVCSGDSGGPIFFKNTVYGVLSGTVTPSAPEHEQQPLTPIQQCDQEFVWTHYTSVLPYSTWIKNVLQNG